ncbi:Glycoside hydrolase superfamily [Penicillium herquei]|nr:Glycoside hydrolase superfamily [Penicillium herquei]
MPNLCYNQDYQATCCTSGKDATTLYDTTTWSEFPDCKNGECPVLDDKKTKILTSSSTGSGNALFDVGDVYPGEEEVIWQERKLCYDDTQTGKKWQNCKWHKDIGSIPNGAVSMFFCCDDQYTVDKTYKNPQLELFEEALDSYLVDGSCVSQTRSTRDVLVTDWDLYGAEGKGLTTCSKSDVQDALFYIIPVLATVMVLQATDYNPVQAANVLAWDTWVTANGWANLVMDTLAPFVQQLSETYEMGATFVAQSILCRPGDWNQLADNKEDSICSGDICDTDADPALCFDDDDDWLLQRRFDISSFDTAEQALLAKEPHKFRVWPANDDAYIEGQTYYHLGYPSAGDWSTFATEHILEIQCLGLFFEAATKGELVSGKTPTFTAIGADFFVFGGDDDDNEDDGGIFNSDILTLDKFFDGDPGEQEAIVPNAGSSWKQDQ